MIVFRCPGQPPGSSKCTGKNTNKAKKRMDWKERVTSMSEHVFAGISHKIDHKSYGNEVTSNLPLQMSLYFNVVFAPVWSTIIVLFLKDHFFQYNELYKFISITVLTTIFLVEILRLYLGYEGNLKDKIPELAGFWMVSVLLQLPLQAFLLFNPYFKFFILELIVQSIMFIILLVQLASGYCALKYTATQQATFFRIMKLRTDITLADIQDRYKVNFN